MSNRIKSRAFLDADLGRPGLRWIDPGLQGRYLTPSELEREKEAIGDFGLTVVAAWMSHDGETTRYLRANTGT